MNRQDLFNYKYIKPRIDKYKRKQEEELAKVTNSTAKIDGMPKAHNKPSYKLEEYVDKKIILDDLNKDDIKTHNSLIGQIRRIKQEKYKSLLYFRYMIFPLESDPVLKTAEEMHRNYYDISRWIKEALVEFDKLDKSRKKTQDNTN